MSTPSKLKPKRHHGFSVLLFILGTLFPPLAVAARFGIGSDFFINLLLTICGYIPGHAHNFYIQNIRNNKNRARTPKWAQRYGLVDTSSIRRKERRSQWANRYNDRLPHSTLEGQAYEEGQEAGSSLSLSSDGHNPRSQQQGQNGALWGPEDENYYNASANASTSSGGRWRYPANFEDAALPSDGPKRSKKKKEKKDRWARTEDAYSISEQQSRKKTKRRKSRASVAPSTISGDSSTVGYPEDPEGGLYGNTQPAEEETNGRSANTNEIFNHEF